MSSEKPIIQSRPDASNEAWETTAQWAKAEASTRELSDEVDKNARREADAAKRAADAALVRPRFPHQVVVWILNLVIRLFWDQHFTPGTTDKTSQTSQAFDKLEHDASLKTQEAVDEGKRDVHEAAAIGSSYLGTAIDTVKVRLSSPSQYCLLWLSVSLYIFRVTSHPASLALLAPAPTPRSKPIEPGLCILLRTVHIGSGLNNWHNTTTSTVHRREHETTGNARDMLGECHGPRQAFDQCASPRGP